ncbi:MAG: hypothetical protein EBZ48_12485 [Proteobacteria bacterium]|nr:hypothetical protein [Pseudomonadota bacterium]
MSNVSTATISVDAPLAAVSELLFALDKYPEWSSSIKAVEVLGRDDLERVSRVRKAECCAASISRPRGGANGGRFFHEVITREVFLSIISE